MFWKERALSQTMQVLAEVASEAKALSSPDAKPENGGMLVSVVAVPSVTDGLLEDEYFGQKFGTALEMQRVPEYCQWEVSGAIDFSAEVLFSLLSCFLRPRASPPPPSPPLYPHLQTSHVTI
jgi:hypothetical protein